MKESGTRNNPKDDRCLQIPASTVHCSNPGASDFHGDASVGDSRRWMRVMTENQELGVEVLAKSSDKNGVSFAKAEDMDSCNYHSHGTDGVYLTQLYWVLEAFGALDCLGFGGCSMGSGIRKAFGTVDDIHLQLQGLIAFKSHET